MIRTGKMYKLRKAKKGMGKSRILITCAKGIAPYLKGELLQLGFPVLSESIAGITVEGTMDDTLRLNLLLRTGHRVLFLLKEFAARDADELYRSLSEIAWEEYIAEDGYVCVTSSVDNPSIRDSRYANVKCKDAIVDRINAQCGQRPDSGPDKDRAVVNLYWKDEECSVYFDTSGESLSRRGYRKIPMTAPMQETLAAAVIRASGWNGSSHFINPMCGSGTLAIEAAFIALNRAPGLLRNNYGFMHLKGFKESLWNELHAQAKREAKKALDCRIIATDISKEALEAAKKNAATAGVEHLIEFALCDYSETAVPDGGGIVILNPEYGERMGKIKELESVYKGIGDYFKQKCRGYTGYIFTGNLDLAKKVGLRAKRKMQFFNGGIECRLLEYELYEGSRKDKKTEML
ncbi:MAG: class I SAM-dependent RNA methyltransferase [Proteobacteria bacterium]|nr:class I SAM-dependent RNA methyltransferase [Pseudomonadota bacterium]